MLSFRKAAMMKEFEEFYFSAWSKQLVELK